MNHGQRLCCDPDVSATFRCLEPTPISQARIHGFIIVLIIPELIPQTFHSSPVYNNPLIY